MRRNLKQPDEVHDRGGERDRSDRQAQRKPALFERPAPELGGAEELQMTGKSLAR